MINVFVSQAKPERTAEESDRLRKLMLEWQFQKRLQESKQSDEDEEEEDDEDVDTMMIMQRLEAEKRARVRRVVQVEEGEGRDWRKEEEKSGGSQVSGPEHEEGRATGSRADRGGGHRQSCLSKAGSGS